MRVFVLLFIFLSSCSSPSPPLASFKGTAMTIDFHILVGNTADTDRVNAIIQNVFAEVDAIYNNWNPKSEVGIFNAHRSITPLPLSPKLHQLLLVTDQVAKVTKGLFDPTIEPIQKLWKRALKNGYEPDEASINTLAPAVGWNKIHFDSDSIRKDHPLTELDLGGIAKGYTVDLLFESLQKNGFDPLYVEWGGEIRVSKHHPEGRAWKIGILDPVSKQAKILLDLSNEAVATSGDYEQFWKVGEKTYFHIIDPRTLKPIERKTHGISSATVLAKTCVLADGIAKTGLFFETMEEAKNWAASFQEEFFFQERK